jgi:hypothetical protein
VALAACEIPSDLPIFQQTWVVPTDSATIGAGTMLPAGVQITGGASPSFQVTTPTTTVNTTLGAVCGQPACQSGTTVNAPVPAFTSPAGLFNSSVAMPSGVTALTVTGGSLTVTVTNNLGFDPLRPNGASAPFGQLIVVTTTGSLTKADTIRGTAASGIANAATTPIAVTLPTGTWGTSVSVALTLVVPAGGNANMASSNALSVQAALTGFAVSQATVVVNGTSVNTTPQSFSLSDLDLVDQVQSGGVDLTVANPLTASASLNVIISAPGTGTGPPVTITKPLTIPATPTSSASISLTQSELRSILGKTGVSIRVSGTASGTGPGNTVSVTPTSQIVLRTQMRLVLNVGA